MQKITSRDNEKLKAARKAREGRLEGILFIEGFRLAEESLQSKLPAADVFVRETLWQSARAADLLSVFEISGVPISLLPDTLFDSIADTKSSQGIIVLGERPDTSFDAFEKRLKEQTSSLPLLILLHEINNPSNLGAIMRTAWAADADGVITTSNSADIFSPKSLRASMGAGFRLNVWTGAEFSHVLSWAKRIGLRSVAADIGATQSYDEVEWQIPRLVVFGSEAHGLTGAELAAVDEGLVIPINPAVESLNLAVAAGVVLFEARKQRR